MLGYYQYEQIYQKRGLPIFPPSVIFQVIFINGFSVLGLEHFYFYSQRPLFIRDYSPLLLGEGNLKSVSCSVFSSIDRNFLLLFYSIAVQGTPCRSQSARHFNED